MFPEHRELITHLKNSDAHFLRLFEKHNGLDHKITSIESKITMGTHEEIETLKKQNRPPPEQKMLNKVNSFPQ